MYFTINGLVYRTIEDKNNEVILQRTEGLKRPVRNIPAEVEHDGKKYKVTAISGGQVEYKGCKIVTCGAFQEDTTLSNISLPETIVEIKGGDEDYCGAFYKCSNLKEINFPDSLQRLGESAFHKCIAIEQLYFGEGLETIEYCAFYGCSSLKIIDFGNKVKKIGRRAFKECTSMTEVNIPASVKEIGGEAFLDSGVKVVNIYSEEINIASDAFPSDAQINFLDANSFPKRKRKAHAVKTTETPQSTPAPKEEEPKTTPALQETEETPFNAPNAAEYTEPKEDYIIIKTSNRAIEEKGNLYDATRGCWKATLEKAQNYKYVLAVVQGIVREVYEVSEWHTSAAEAPRIEFTGKPTTNADMRQLVGKRLPATYTQKGAANPFMYKKA